MFIEVNLPVGMPVDRDEIEDEILEEFEGKAEITGAGVGEFGSNLDVEIDPSISREEALQRIASLLARMEVVEGATLHPGYSDDWIQVAELL